MNKKLTKNDLQKIAETRNHSIISFENYQNVKSKVTIHCYTCDTTWETTVHSYKNAKKTGCPTCKKKVASETHTGKITSEETKLKIGAKASLRPGSLTGKKGENHPRYKGSVGRYLKNPTYEDYDWKNAVRKRCNYTCVITREKFTKTSETKYVCHHLNSFNSYEHLRYLPENGVFLKREIHWQFHKLYGFGNNTEDQFADFCSRFYNIDWWTRKEELGF